MIVFFLLVLIANLLCFFLQVVNAVTGNEEYVHLKSLEDEYHYMESNMPPKEGESKDHNLDDREEYQRVESPRKPSTLGENKEGEEEEMLRGEGRREDVPRDYEGGATGDFHGLGDTGNTDFTSDQGSYRKEIDPMLFTQEMHSPFTNLFHSQSKQQQQSQQSHRSGLYSPPPEAERQSGEYNDSDTNQGDDYEQHVFLQEPVSIPSVAAAAALKEAPPSLERTQSPMTSNDLGQFSASLKNTSGTPLNQTMSSQRSSYESLHEID